MNERAVTSVALSATTTCAVEARGDLWCWGSNYSGQLGPGPVLGIDAAEPVRFSVAGPWRAVAAAGMHSAHVCAVHASGSAWCWGQAADYQLGNGGTELWDPFELEVRSNGERWVSIAASTASTCGVRQDGTLWCWGWNRATGFDTGSHTELPTQVGSDTDWRSVHALHYHACALKRDDSLWCWGAETNGKLGFDAQGSQDPGFVATSYAVVSPGVEHSCGVRVDGSLWCWGSNEQGQLGLGPPTGIFPTPIQINADLDWVGVAAGEAHSCGLKANGRVLCWGSNSDLQLGIADETVVITEPAPIGVDNREYTAIAAGWSHNCAVESTGALYCWGSGSNLQHGQEEHHDIAAPSLVSFPDPP